MTFQTSLWGRGSSPSTLLQVSCWCQTLALGHRGPSSEMRPVPHGGSPVSRHSHVHTHTPQKLGQAEGGGGCRKDKWIGDTCIRSPVVPRLQAGCKALKTPCHPPGGTPPARGRPQESRSRSALPHFPLAQLTAATSRMSPALFQDHSPAPTNFQEPQEDATTPGRVMLGARAPRSPQRALPARHQVRASPGLRRAACITGNQPWEGGRPGWSQTCSLSSGPASTLLLSHPH